MPSETIKVKCEGCGMIVVPDDKGKCPVCRVKIKVKENIA